MPDGVQSPLGPFRRIASEHKALTEFIDIYPFYGNLQTFVLRAIIICLNVNFYSLALLFAALFIFWYFWSDHRCYSQFCQTLATQYTK